MLKDEVHRNNPCTENDLKKKEFRTPRLLFHQQNFGAQLATCLLDVVRVCKPKEITSSTIFKYSE
jgi:hypothetical protein